MNIANALRDISAWGPDAVGSTRAVGLMRIALGGIAILRFGAEMAPFAMPEIAGIVYGLIFYIFAAGTILGIRARASTAMLGITILILYGFTKSGIGPMGWGHHHVYILGVSCLLLSLTDCGRSYSVDRWRALKSGGPVPAETGVLWGQRLIALQMGALYFWTAVDKTDRAFLSGERLEQTFTWVYSGRALEFLLVSPTALMVLSCLVVVVEYGLGVAIILQRWLYIAIPVGLALHASFYLLLPVDTYSVTMMVLYLALLDPDAVRKFTDRMQS